MAFLDSIHRYEGLAINGALLFDSSDYTYWKTRMRVFLQSEDVEIWDVIKEGLFVPTKLVDGRSVKKLKDEWNDNDKRCISYNHKVMHILYYSLRKSQFNKVQ